ncbi:hypothetical protein C0068_07535 [Zhongshania marina]|uniref:Uncharacterized protein n=1 Tax=Zhongshania marina TaxID=2304603 RepID=A0A2S4HH07_9GAMM|nr:hypothetical protein C0068_07535 [Marortus luteolus]
MHRFNTLRPTKPQATSSFCANPAPTKRNTNYFYLKINTLNNEPNSGTAFAFTTTDSIHTR